MNSGSKAKLIGCISSIPSNSTLAGSSALYYVDGVFGSISEPVIDLLITYCNLFNFLVGLFSTYGDLFGPSLNKCK